MATHKNIRRVAITGGPAAGKTAIIDVLRRHLDQRVVVLPEAATTLFSGGFPRPKRPPALRYLQKTIFEVQRNMEEIYALQNPDIPHICDRGALDGAAYWPGGLERFLGAMGTSLDAEYGRYEAVVFLETCAYDDDSYPVENPFRLETSKKARRLDQKLQEIWGEHPNFHLIGHETQFYEKVAAVLFKLQEILGVDGGIPQRKPARKRPAKRAKARKKPPTKTAP